MSSDNQTVAEWLETAGHRDVLTVYEHLCMIEEVHHNFPAYRAEMLDLEARTVAAVRRHGKGDPPTMQFKNFRIEAHMATYARDGVKITMQWVTCKGLSPQHTRIANPQSIVTTVKAWKHGMHPDFAHERGKVMAAKAMAAE